MSSVGDVVPLRENPYRERLIRSILEKRQVPRIAAGIMGAEVCQLCGEVGAFWGWATAIGTHPGGEFVAPAHQHGSHDKWRRRLERQSHRFCEICAARISRREREEHTICHACREERDRRFPGIEVREWLRELSFRRYVQVQDWSDEQLRSYDLNLEMLRLEAEEEGLGGLERLRLEIDRGGRAREALRRVGELHGVDYLGGES